MIIKFNEEKHKYYLENEDGSPLHDTLNKPFVSVSKFLDYFTDPFNEQEQAEKFVSSKNNVLKLKNKQEVLNYWKLRRDCGTALHKKREDAAIDLGAFTYTIDEHGDKICYSIDELRDLRPGVYTELTIPLMSAWLIGTADQVKVEEKDGKRWVSILDFKGFSLDTPIATKSGWKTIEEIKVGDEIFDGNGNLTTIKNVSSIHHNPCYKITFDSNDTLICDHEHKWEIKTRKTKYSDFSESTMTTLEMIELLNKKQSLYISIPKLELPDIELPLDPYILGLWLGDGNRTVGTITCMNQEIWDEIAKRGFKVSIDHNRKENNKAESRTIYGIVTALYKLNLIGNKHLPDLYMRASYNQRLELLRGFMDADGHFHRKRRRVVMITTKLWQAEAISQICASLGIKTTSFHYKTTGFGKENISAISVNMTPDVNIFLCRNLDYLEVIGKPRSNFFYNKHRQIKSIELVDTVPTKCLEVESEAHTYLIGKQLIKTHNTNGHKLNIKPQKYYSKEKGYSDFKYFYAPINHVPCDTFQKYTYQLSAYAYFLEKLGYHVDKLEIESIIMNDKGEEEKSEILPVEYKKKDIVQMIEHYKLKRK